MAIYPTGPSGVFETSANGVYTPVMRTISSTVIDGFEDGDLSEWRDDPVGSASDFDIVDDAGGEVYNGVYACACPGGTTASMTSATGLSSYPAPGDTYAIRFYMPSVADGFAYLRYAWQDRYNFYYMMPRPGDGTWRLRKNNGSVHETLAQTNYNWQADTWYRAELEWGTAGTMTASLYKESNGSLEAEVTASDTEYGQGGVGILTYNIPSTWYIDTLTLNTDNRAWDHDLIDGEVSNTSYSTNTVDMTLYSSQKLIDERGRESERVAARYLQKAFEDAQVSYRIQFGYSAKNPPDEGPICGTGALSWWRGAAKEYTADDSNMLLLRGTNGGCGDVGGQYATSPGPEYGSHTIPWRSAGQGGTFHDLHTIIHECAHNLGISHDMDDTVTGEQHTGYAWVEDHGSEGEKVHETPNFQGWDVENYCGEYLEDPGGSYPFVWEMLWHWCTIEHLDITP